MQVTARAPLIAILLLTAPVPAQTLMKAAISHAQDLLSRASSGQVGGIACVELDASIAKALIGLGEQARSDSLERATTAFRLAEKAARCAGSEALTGAALNGVSDVLFRRGELDGALAAAQESIRIHERLQDTAGQAEAWKNVANAEGARSPLRSLDAIHRALDLWIAAGDRRGEAIALNNIGNVHKV